MQDLSVIAPCQHSQPIKTLDQLRSAQHLYVKTAQHPNLQSLHRPGLSRLENQGPRLCIYFFRTVCVVYAVSDPPWQYLPTCHNWPQQSILADGGRVPQM